MRYLGIDYGTKRVGVSISDEGGTIAFPHAIIENNRNLLEEIQKICVREKVGMIVVGESVDDKGVPNIVMKKIEAFIAVLQKHTNLPIVTEREFFTTQQARFFQKDKARVDDSAAALILQSYLDSKNRKSVLETI